MTTSLIISTYNWPSALRLVLDSVLHQKIKPTEIHIADDGSTTETRTLIENFIKSTEIPTHHIWHADDGFRLSEIRNKAIKAASGDYIIQIDGDTILHDHFIKDHITLAEPNVFLTGSRVLLNEETTLNALTERNLELHPWAKGIKNRFNAVHLPDLNQFRKAHATPIEKLIFKVRGCNMSFWRADLLAVNGYNEDIRGWGREDSEIALRLLKKGTALKKIKNAAIQYHLYHKEASKNQLQHNEELLNSARLSDNFKIKNGIQKL